MGGHTTSSSSSSSESSQQGMEKFQHLNHRQPPPPRPIHSRGKKHHHHRHHYCPSSPSPSPSPSGHRRHQILEHSPMERPHHNNLPPPTSCPDHHHHKEGKLRVKPPKHLKKVHKLHRKIMKAYKLPKSARPGTHHCHHVHFPPPEEGIFGAPFCHHHPPNCCLHSSEAMEGSSVVHEMSFRHHHHPRCHGRYPHPRHPSRPLTKPDIAGDEVAPVSPQAMETSAEPPIEGGTMPLTADMPPADEPAPVMQAP